MGSPNIDLFKLFEIYNPSFGYNSCVGYAPTKGKRCGWHMYGSIVAIQLEDIGTNLPHVYPARAELIEVATDALCHHHKNQARDITTKWTNLIKNLDLEDLSERMRNARMNDDDFNSNPRFGRSESAREEAKRKQEEKNRQEERAREEAKRKLEEKNRQEERVREEAKRKQEEKNRQEERAQEARKKLEEKNRQEERAREEARTKREEEERKSKEERAKEDSRREQERKDREAEGETRTWKQAWARYTGSPKNVKSKKSTGLLGLHSWLTRASVRA